MNSRMSKHPQEEHGFTLVELLVVIAILGILMAILVINLAGSREAAVRARAEHFASQLDRSLGSSAVGVWDFAGNANDSSGHNNHGNVDGATLTTDRNEQEDRAYSFNGIGDSIAASITPTLNGDRTFAAWIEPTAGTEAMVVVEEGVSGAAQMYYVYSTGVNSGKLAVDSWGRGWFFSSALVNIGQWNHVAFVYVSSTRTIKFYINGTYDTETSAYTSPGFYDTDAINIGGDPIGSSGNYYAGKIDDVRIFSRAVTSGEIELLYAAGKEQRGIAWQ
ncbi:MAG: LamG-like jellyroll fold domain-containing protein [Candidatus Yanofskybacteria bacterium]|nr:LamG-like jellyroll fold domain-containing protein [Candidatus Yanofskybacteria bacterium]